MGIIQSVTTLYMWLRSDFPKFIEIGEIMYMCVAYCLRDVIMHAQ